MRRDGMTLVEVLIGLVVLVIAGVGLMNAYQSGLQAMETAQQSLLAMDDIQDILERIKTTPFAMLNANFPNGAPGGIVGGGPDLYAPIVGGYAPDLQGEQITVTHSPTTAADPRELVVQVQWTNRGRQYQRNLSTIRASQTG